MFKRILAPGLLVVLLLALGLGPPNLAQAQPSATVYGVTVSNKLVRFNSSSPGTIQNTVQITGLQANENLLGIDFRPATGQLYGLGSTSRLYTIDLSGLASPVGSSVLTTTLNGTDFGFDFNPTLDYLRVTSNNDQNMRLNPNTGGILAVDFSLVISGTNTNPNVVASAYSNNVPGASTTTLYDIDSGLDVLLRQDPPNSGQLFNIGPLGANITDLTGFDIAGSNTALACLSFTNGPPNTSGLYTVNLATGTLGPIAYIGTGEYVRDISIALTAAPATVTALPTTIPTSAAATTVVPTTPVPTTGTATQPPTTATAPPATSPTSAPQPPTPPPGTIDYIRADSPTFLTSTLIIREVGASQPGWIVIHESNPDGTINLSSDIGHTRVASGTSFDVVVLLNRPIGAATTNNALRLDNALLDGETVWPTLHTDTGTADVYDYPAADPPVLVNGNIVAVPVTFATVGMPRTGQPDPYLYAIAAVAALFFTLIGLTIAWKAYHRRRSGKPA